MKTKIAVVDDEKNVRFALRKFLEAEDFEVREFSDGKEALTSLSENDFVPDIYVLDIMMPVMDGIMFLQKYKPIAPEIPAIFLTSRDEEFDKVLGLELGADDYLTKPFSMKELLARIKVILRRYKNTIVFTTENENTQSSTDSSESNKKDLDSSQILNGSLILDTKSFTAKSKNEGTETEIPLTVTEFRILELFMKNPLTVFNREQILQAAYPEDIYLNDRAIDCHIKRLRKKIGSERIETVYGMGYKFK
ncbi:response regulator transcription factor [Treponema sp.]|uniref:response regulator transcription factor n=1 Tax=Treponema sp. TaxID=166 RepID=UPI0038906C16